MHDGDQCVAQATNPKKWHRTKDNIIYSEIPKLPQVMGMSDDSAIIR